MFAVKCFAVKCFAVKCLLRGRTENFRGPASSQHYISGGGSPGKKSESIRSQLRALATRTPSLGRCGQGAWL